MGLFSKIFKGVATGGLSEVFGGGGDSGGGGGSSSSVNQDSQIGASENAQAAKDSTQGKDNAIVLGTGSKLNEAGIVLDGNATGNTITVTESSQTAQTGIPLAPVKPEDATAEKPKDNTTLIFWGVGLLVTVLAAIAFSRSQRKSA